MRLIAAAAVLIGLSVPVHADTLDAVTGQPIYSQNTSVYIPPPSLPRPPFPTPFFYHASEVVKKNGIRIITHYRSDGSIMVERNTDHYHPKDHPSDKGKHSKH